MRDVVIPIDDDLLDQFDRAVRERGLNRAEYLAQLIARELGRGEQGGAGDADLRQALHELDELFAGLGGNEDATMAIRQERDAR